MHGYLPYNISVGIHELGMKEYGPSVRPSVLEIMHECAVATQSLGKSVVAHGGVPFKWPCNNWRSSCCCYVTLLRFAYPLGYMGGLVDRVLVFFIFRTPEHSWSACSSSVLPNLVVSYHEVAMAFESERDNFQKAQRRHAASSSPQP